MVLSPNSQILGCQHLASRVLGTRLWTIAASIRKHLWCALSYLTPITLLRGRCSCDGEHLVRAGSKVSAGIQGSPRPGFGGTSLTSVPYSPWQMGDADLVSDLLPDLLTLSLHARVLGLTLLLLLPQSLLSLLLLLLRIWVLLLLSPQHLPHILGGP